MDNKHSVTKELDVTIEIEAVWRRQGEAKASHRPSDGVRLYERQ